MTEFAKGLIRAARCIVTILEAGYHAQPNAVQFGGGL